MVKARQKTKSTFFCVGGTAKTKTKQKQNKKKHTHTKKPERIYERRVKQKKTEQKEKDYQK